MAPTLAVLAGFTTVKQGMDDPAFAAFVSDLMMKEIAPAIPYRAGEGEGRSGRPEGGEEEDDRERASAARTSNTARSLAVKFT